MFELANTFGFFDPPPLGAPGSGSAAFGVGAFAGGFAGVASLLPRSLARSNK
jgi:hypothetical protein